MTQTALSGPLLPRRRQHPHADGPCRLGVGTVQLRVKGLGDAQATALVREAVESIEGLPVRLVVNDYWRAAIAGGASHVISVRRIWRRPMSQPFVPRG